MNNNHIHSKAKLIVSLRHETPQYSDEKIAQLFGLTISEFNHWIKEHAIYITLYEKHETEYVARLYKFENRLIKIEKLLKEIKKNNSRSKLDNIEEEIYSRISEHEKHLIKIMKHIIKKENQDED